MGLGLLELTRKTQFIQGAKRFYWNFVQMKATASV